MQSVAMNPRLSIALCLAALLAGAFVSRADAADVHVDAIVVKPASPVPAALCELKVRLKNSGSRSASYFRFNVKIDGQDVPEYKVYTYPVNIDPGTAGELALNNFYSPAEARSFEVQVTLVEAQWVEVKKDGTSTTTTPSGAVAGLPTGASLSVKVSLSKS
ncbi:MAG: hypothetical protein ABSH46_06135 [Bryobacteraceae bacterium]